MEQHNQRQLATLSRMDADLQYVNNTYTGFSNDSRNSNSGDMSSHNISDYQRENDTENLQLGIFISRLIICILGVVGNGIVIWLLGFHVQRNPFMTYILNLAIADLGLLISLLSLSVHFLLFNGSDFYEGYILVSLVCIFFSLLTYSTGQFLLTAISIDRCVAIFFPLWHRCHRPPRLSTIVCALMWDLSFLLTTITLTSVMVASDIHRIPLWVYSVQFIVNVVLCLPLMTISTVALFVKVCFKQRQHRRGKLMTILLLTLSFFLLFAFPFNVIIILHSYRDVHGLSIDCAMLLGCLNSTVNPVIYFLVGRQRKSHCRESLKMILQRAFKEEEGGTEEAPAETQL